MRHIDNRLSDLENRLSFASIPVFAGINGRGEEAYLNIMTGEITTELPAISEIVSRSEINLENL